MAIVTNTASTTTITRDDAVELKDAMFRDELLTFSDAGTVKKGTILARDTASGKLVPFVKGGAGGAESPKAILTYDVQVDAAGDASIRAAVVGKFRKQKLIIAADGDDSNIDNAVMDSLRQVSLIPIDVYESTII